MLGKQLTYNFIEKFISKMKESENIDKLNNVGVLYISSYI